MTLRIACPICFTIIEPARYDRLRLSVFQDISGMGERGGVPLKLVFCALCPVKARPLSGLVM